MSKHIFLSFKHVQRQDETLETVEKLLSLFLAAKIILGIFVFCAKYMFARFVWDDSYLSNFLGWKKNQWALGRMPTQQ